MNLVAVLLGALLAGFAHAEHTFPRQEKGDVVFRDLASELNMHPAIYVRYSGGDVSGGGPTVLDLHELIEMEGPTEFVRDLTLATFIADAGNQSDYRGARIPPGPLRENREPIIQAATSPQLRSIRYVDSAISAVCQTILWDRDPPIGNGDGVLDFEEIRGMRSDLWVEYAYARAGIPIQNDIIRNPDFYIGPGCPLISRILPSDQFAAMFPTIFINPLVEVRTGPGINDPLVPDGGVTGDDTLAIHASDVLSNVSIVELWQGDPDTSPLVFRDTDEFFGLVKVSQVGPLAEGRYTTRVFDQAGNDSSVNFIIDQTRPMLAVKSGEGYINEDGTVTTDNQIYISAYDNPAPSAGLDSIKVYKDGGATPWLATSNSVINQAFPASAWYWVLACDKVDNCSRRLFGIFPVGSNPPGPPNPPPGPPYTPPTPPYLPPDPDPEDPPCMLANRDRAAALQGCRPGGPGGPDGPGGPGNPDFPGVPIDPEIGIPKDPNAKSGTSGSVAPGQMMSYTVEFENEGDGLALGVYVTDVLDPALDDSTLAVRDFMRVDYADNSAVPATFPWSYDRNTRALRVMTGDAGPAKGGRFTLDARLKPDVPVGTVIANRAIVHFPNALVQETPTNAVVAAVARPTQLAYTGPSSGTCLDTVRLKAVLSSDGRPLPGHVVEYALDVATGAMVADSSGTVSSYVALMSAPGTYPLQASYAGDGFYYAPSAARVDFGVQKRSVFLEAPQASGRRGEAATITLAVTDAGSPLLRQGDEPKTVYLELLGAGGAASPLAEALVQGSSVVFQFAFPDLPAPAAALRARFDGDSRYLAAASTGTLRLIDTSPPRITIQSPYGGAFSGAQLVRVAFSITDEDPAPSIDAVLSHESGQTLGVANGQELPASSLAAGDWTLGVRAVDWFGNRAEASAPSFTITQDDLPPTLTITPVDAGTVTSATPALAVVYADAGIGVDPGSVRLSLDGVDVTALAAVTASSATFVSSAPLAQGAHVFLAEAADLVGNRAAGASAFVIDSIPPVTTLLMNGSPVSSTSLVMTSTDSVGFAAVDGGTGVLETRYRLDDSSASAVYSSTFNLTVGVHALRFHSVDIAGNLEVETIAVLDVRPLDGDPPVLRLDYPASEGIGVEQAVGGVVNVRGSAGDESGLNWTLSVGSAVLASGTGDVSGVLADWDTTSLSGPQTLTLSAVDTYGNAASTTATVFVGKPVFAFAVGRKDSQAIVSTLKGPTGIAVRSDGAIWVASKENDKILLISPAGVLLGEAGHAPGHSGEDEEHGKKGKDDKDRGRDDRDDDDDEEDAGGVSFKTPQGLALDATDNLYVADRDLNRVLKLAPDGGAALRAFGRKGSGPGELKHPFDVAVDANGDVYVADSGNRRIQVFDSSGTFLRQFGQGVLLSTSEVRGIALASEGLWVSDKETELVHLFARSGSLIKTISGADSAVGELSRMRGLACDRLGALYVVEPNRDRVQKFDPRGRGLLAFGSKAGLAHADKKDKRYLTEPVDAAMAPDGSLWVADTGRDRVVRYALPAAGGYGVAASPAGGSSAEPARRLVDHKDGAKVERDDGTGVDVPKGALAADVEITVDKADEAKDAEEKAAKRRGNKVKPASEEVEYGPEGTRFDKPVTLTLAYEPGPGLDEKSLKVHYWNPVTKDWEALDSVVDEKARTVSAQTTHFSVYQVQGAGSGIGVSAAMDEFGLRDAYAFPNPSRSGAAITFRIQPGLADSIEVRVYDLSGRKVHSSSNFRFLGAFDDGNAKGAQNTYDHVWDVSGIGSGVYTYAITAKKAGQADIRKTGKVGVIH